MADAREAMNAGASDDIDDDTKPRTIKKPMVLHISVTGLHFGLAIIAHPGACSTSKHMVNVFLNYNKAQADIIHDILRPLLEKELATIMSVPNPLDTW